MMGEKKSKGVGGLDVYTNAPYSSNEQEKCPTERVRMCATRYLWNPMPIIDVIWCVVVEWGEIGDQAAALEVGMGSSACRMLDTHLDRMAESSAMNESVFVA